MKPRVLIINGSLGGSSGNTGAALRALLPHLKSVDLDELELCKLAQDPWPRELVRQLLAQASGFVFATGTYWDSWGSPLQRFLEQTTEHEGTSVWLGKPAMCLVTMHAVGGKEVLSRLQGVLSTLGVLLPPMSGMAYSLTGQETLRSSTRDASFDADIWSLEDFQKMSTNFLSTLDAVNNGHLKFEAWPVDARDPARPWLDRQGVSSAD